MKIHSDDHGVHIRLTRVEKNHLRAVPTGLTPRTGHRRELLKQMVARECPSPAQAVERVIIWFDDSMSAGHWFSLSDVEPDRAAMLLCQHDPNSGTLEHAKQCTNDITGPQDLLRLQQRFEDLAKCKPQHRTLLQWLEFARRSKLRYHPWIDQYVEAAGLAADAPTAAEPVPEPDAAPPLSTPQVQVGADSRQPPAKRRTRRLGWRDTSAWDYTVEMLRNGNFGTCKDLHDALFNEAGSPGSPFVRGIESHRGRLFIAELKKSIALQTMQNAWTKLREAAAKKN